jgi:hypothetical protein
MSVGDVRVKPKLKKLSIQRQTLRLLTDDELARTGGAASLRCMTTVDWCSTESNSKCYAGATNPCRPLK